MPKTNEILWKEYTANLISSSSIRRLLSILPYFPSETINYDLKLTRNKKTFDKRLIYEWKLINSVDKTVVEGHGGKNEINVLRFNEITSKKQAISLGRIPEKGQYKVQLLVGNGVESSPYTDILDITVKGDEVENRIVWIVGGAAIIVCIVALALLLMM